MDLINYKLQQLTMVFPTLPNDIILKIIKQADGGVNTHKKKMMPIIKEINQDNHKLHQIRKMKETYTSQVEEGEWQELHRFMKQMRFCGLSVEQICPEEYLPEGYK